jgi:hypothetical protein
MFPKSLEAVAVPVPEVVPPALSMVSEIELSTVPVTVKVPDDVAPYDGLANDVTHSNRATAMVLERDFFRLTVSSPRF